MKKEKENEEEEKKSLDECIRDLDVDFKELDEENK